MQAVLHGMYIVRQVRAAEVVFWVCLALMPLSYMASTELCRTAGLNVLFVCWFAGNIYCDGGYYCPDPLTKLPCTEGHFCKQGSDSMTACPALVKCPAGTETPTDNYAGLILDGAFFLLLATLWHASHLYNRLVRRLASKERVRIMWHKMQPQVCVLL